MAQELTPPETLTPPEAVEAVAPEQAGGMVKIDKAQLPALEQRADTFIGDILKLEAQSDDFRQRLDAIHSMGNEESRAAAAVSSRFMDRPAKASDMLKESNVGRGLSELRRIVEDLDPATQGDLFTPRKILGIIPGGNKLREYFMRYESSQKNIGAILDTLYRSQDELKKDNASLEQEKVNLWNTMQALQQYVIIGKTIDERVSSRIAQLEVTDPEKARVVRDELLYAVRQKVQDLLVQQAVCIQGYLALDMVKKNNLELIKGVDRASTTTVMALRTAVIVAQALANQKLVLDQISAMNATTSSLIESTAKMMQRQSDTVAQQAMSTSVDLEKLKSAFNSIYGAMDSFSEYRGKALESMGKTIEVLSTETDKAQKYLNRARGEGVAAELGKAQAIGFKI